MDTFKNIAQRYFLLPKSPTTRMVFTPHAHVNYSGLCAYIALAAVNWDTTKTILLVSTNHYCDRNCTPQTPFFQQHIQIAPFPGVEPCDVNIINKEHSWQFLMPLLHHFTRDRLVNLHLVLLRTASPKINKTILKMMSDPNTVLIGNSDLYHGDPADVLVDSSDAVNVLLNGSGSLPRSTCGPAVFQTFLALRGPAVPHVACMYNSGQPFVEQGLTRFTPKDLFCKTNRSVDRVVGYASFVYTAATAPLTPYEQYYLTAAAYKALGRALYVPRLQLPLRAGVFVTIKSPDGSLRGCVGTLAASPVTPATKTYAKAAAFHDSRFAPMTPAELAACSLTVTLLDPLREISLQGYLQSFRAGVHGVHLRVPEHSAYFLPVVGGDMLAAGEEAIARKLLSMLCKKAGLATSCYTSAALRLEVNTGTKMLKL